ncbi:collagen alpha-1(I) chain-like [Drosophila bipectinata]|uniref:collagen alpha-1(I) chain-like n=1 Tax=Drosophila bipectinata TaxID=42026 RepID=UPI0038B40A98
MASTSSPSSSATSSASSSSSNNNSDNNENNNTNNNNEGPQVQDAMNLNPQETIDEIERNLLPVMNRLLMRQEAEARMRALGRLGTHDQQDPPIVHNPERYMRHVLGSRRRPVQRNDGEAGDVGDIGDFNHGFAFGMGMGVGLGLGMGEPHVMSVARHGGGDAELVIQPQVPGRIGFAQYRGAGDGNRDLLTLNDVMPLNQQRYIQFGHQGAGRAEGGGAGGGGPGEGAGEGAGAGPRQGPGAAFGLGPRLRIGIRLRGGAAAAAAAAAAAGVPLEDFGAGGEAIEIMAPVGRVRQRVVARDEGLAGVPFEDFGAGGEAIEIMAPVGSVRQRAVAGNEGLAPVHGINRGAALPRALGLPGSQGRGEAEPVVEVPEAGVSRAARQAVVASITEAVPAVGAPAERNPEISSITDILGTLAGGGLPERRLAENGRVRAPARVRSRAEMEGSFSRLGYERPRDEFDPASLNSFFGEEGLPVGRSRAEVGRFPLGGARSDRRRSPFGGSYADVGSRSLGGNYADIETPFPQGGFGEGGTSITMEPGFSLMRPQRLPRPQRPQTEMGRPSMERAYAEVRTPPVTMGGCSVGCTPEEVGTPSVIIRESSSLGRNLPQVGAPSIDTVSAEVGTPLIRVRGLSSLGRNLPQGGTPSIHTVSPEVGTPSVIVRGSSSLGTTLAQVGTPSSIVRGSPSSAEVGTPSAGAPSSDVLPPEVPEDVVAPLEVQPVEVALLEPTSSVTAPPVVPTQVDVPPSGVTTSSLRNFTNVIREALDRALDLEMEILREVAPQATQETENNTIIGNNTIVDNNTEYPESLRQADVQYILRLCQYIQQLLTEISEELESYMQKLSLHRSSRDPDGDAL